MIKQFSIVIAMASVLAMAFSTSVRCADLIPFGSEWFFHHPQSIDDEPSSIDNDFDDGWFTPGFDLNDPIQWDGPEPAPFAYGNPGGAHINAFTDGNANFVREVGTFLDQPPSGDRWTAYFRHNFTTTSTSTGIALEVLTDDGAQFYLDGNPIASLNCCEGDPDPPIFIDVANAVGNEDSYSFLAVEGLVIEPGDHVLGVSVHQANQTSSDLGFSFRMVDGFVPPPPPVEIMAPGQTWSFFEGLEEPSGGTLDWTTPGFDASDWDSGEEGFGYETGGGSVDLLVNTELIEMPDDGFNDEPYSTLYLRREFSVDNPGQFDQLVLSIDYDDGFIAYINGEEVARSVGQPGEQWFFDDLGSLLTPAANHESSNGNGPPEEFFIDLTNFPNLLANGEGNIIAIQGINQALDSSDFVLAQIGLGGIPSTTGDPGDFDNNGALEEADIEALFAELRAGTNDPLFDLNADGAVDSEDSRIWVDELRKTWFGDANLDGEFNSSDFVQIFQRGEFEDGIAGNSSWGDGDWDGDAEFTTSDFVVAFVAGGFELGPREAVANVPEPSSWILLIFGATAILRLRRFSKMKTVRH